MESDYEDDEEDVAEAVEKGHTHVGKDLHAPEEDGSDTLSEDENQCQALKRTVTISKTRKSIRSQIDHKIFEAFQSKDKSEEQRDENDSAAQNQTLYLQKYGIFCQIPSLYVQSSIIY